MLNKSNFEIAVLAPDDENTPSILRGIYVSPEGTRVTDGRFALCISSVDSPQGSLFTPAEDVEPAEFFTAFVLDRESALKIAKAIPKKKDPDESRFAIIDATTENNERAMVSVNDLQRQEILRARKIEGQFPNIDRATPELGSEKFSITMNPDMLTDVLKVITKFCAATKCISMKMSFYGAGKALRIDADGGEQKLMAIVMPQRSDESEAENAA